MEAGRSSDVARSAKDQARRRDVTALAIGRRARHRAGFSLSAIRRILRPVNTLVISCTGSKRPGTHRALDLYTPRQFKIAREFAARPDWRVMVLSAEHGLIDGGDVIECYDRPMTKARAAELSKATPANYPSTGPVLVYGGKQYRGIVRAWAPGGVWVVRGARAASEAFAADPNPSRMAPGTANPATARASARLDRSRHLAAWPEFVAFARIPTESSDQGATRATQRTDPYPLHPTHRAIGV